MTPNNTSNTPPPPIPGGWMQTPTGWIPSDTATNYGALIGLPGAKPYDTSVSPPSSTIDANAVATGQTAPSVQFPSNVPTSGSAANNANTTNTSVPSTIPQVTDITGQESKQTPGETTNMDLLAQKANAIGGQSSLATYQTNQESGAGVPGMQKTINDLNTKLQGLTDQSTALQLDAAPGGTIQNKEQLANAGYGVTAAAMSVGNAADLRKNQIQQASIAAQSLTLKSAIYAAQGNLSLAKDAADKAAQVQFDAETQKINYIIALIDANKPQMTKEEQAQADTVKAQLQDRSDAIAAAKQDKVTGVGLAAAAMKNNPGDAQAQYAAQQALALNPDDPNYLQKVSQLVGKYQSDPIATQQALANLANTRANTQKTKLDIKALGDAAAGVGDVSSPVVQGWVTAIKNGQAKLSDITAAELKGNPQLKNNVIAALGAGGNSQTDILNTSIQSLQSLNDMVSSNHGFSAAVGAKGILEDPLGFFTLGMASHPLPGSSAADFNAKLSQVKNDVILPNLTLLHGLGRVTDREFQALTAAVTALGDNESQSQFKTDLATLTTTLQKKAQDSGIAVNPASAPAGQQITVQGHQFQVGTQYKDAKGNTGSFDASGKWIPAQ